MLYLTFFLAFFWGALWAIYLQFTTYGHYLAIRRTWITVVIGVGMDLFIMLFFVPLRLWVQICTVIFLSSLGIIARSLYNEHQDENAINEIQYE